MKIVILDGYAVNPGDMSWNALSALGMLTVYDETPESLILERIGDAEAVFTNKTPLTEAIFCAAPNLKWVGVLATGFDVVDISAAKRHGIPVCNIPEYGTAAVAEMVFALLFELFRHVGEYSDAVRNGEWINSKYYCFFKSPMAELYGKTIGILGYGRIGQATGKIAQAFGMKVLAYSRHPGRDSENMRYVSLDELLTESDIISLHCPMSEATRKIINRQSIAKMKDGAILINTSRGGLVDDAALTDALNSGKLSGAALDVISREPMESGNPLLDAKNIIITPHVAWAAREARERLIAAAAENLRSYIDGRIINAVNL